MDAAIKARLNAEIDGYPAARPQADRAPSGCTREDAADVADSHAGPTAVPQDAELTRARRRAVYRAGVPPGLWAVAGLAVTGGRNLLCVLPWPL
ncbi:hypothetical protein [Streptomyces sp. NPDC002763]|uniref:hypothetical protein n=1 Tax=Streptomyces sp. NPDC002763 TaxID=3154427 RepID=UPI003322BF44